MRLRTTVATALALALSIAQAQPVPNTGTATSPGAKMMKVAGTQPIQMEGDNRTPGRFRMMFRLLGQIEREIPIYVIRSSQADVFEWLAFTSSGARCNVELHSFKGVGILPNSGSAEQNVRALAKETNSQWNVSKTRPTIVVADFDCDARLKQGDAATVQVKFYLYDGNAWVPADYTFENLTVGTGS